MSVKKKMQQEYTPDTQEKKASTLIEMATNVFNLALKVKEVIFLLSTVSLWVLGLWLSYKLTPFVQSDRDAAFRIQAVESDISTLKTDLKVIVENVNSIKADTQYIKGVLSK